MIGCFSRLAFNLLVVAYFFATFGYVLFSSNGLRLERSDGLERSEVPFWAGAE